MGSDLPDCDPDIYENGTTVLVTHSMKDKAIEGWVKKVAEQSGQPVDWFWLGGRAIVRTTGDVATVRKTMYDLQEEHDQLFFESINPMFRDHARPPSFDMWWEE